MNPDEFRLTSASNGRWLLVVIFIEAGVALSIRVPLVLGHEPWGGFFGPTLIPDFLALLVVPLVVLAAWRLVRQQRHERIHAFRTSRLMDTVLHTSREWLWTTGPDWRFTFSGPACMDMTGYEPSELLGRHFSLVIDPADVADTQENRQANEGADFTWSDLIAVCHHRDGSQVLVDVSGRPMRDRDGRDCGFEGTCRALDTGTVIGAEALTRFISSRGISPEVWFVEAASVGLEVELEILALRTALTAAAGLPPDLYAAVNLSPRACLDLRLMDVIKGSAIPARRIVLEVTERHEVTDYRPLAEALAPLRRSGLRIAVDDAGAGFASMRHILQLKPDLIKLDRAIIAGIDTDPGQRALGAAMVGFSSEIGAVLVAEGIETEAELTAVTKLGMTAAQGYLLGRPSVRPEDWTQWQQKPLDNGWPRTSTQTADG